MAKNINKLMKSNIFIFVSWLIGIFVTIGIGGLFLNGFFLDVPLLDWFGQGIHTIVAWTIYILTAIPILAKIMDFFK